MARPGVIAILLLATAMWVVDGIVFPVLHHKYIRASINDLLIGEPIVPLCHLHRLAAGLSRWVPLHGKTLTWRIRSHKGSGQGIGGFGPHFLPGLQISMPEL